MLHMICKKNYLIDKTMNTTESQSKQILNHLLTGKSLTPITALIRFNCLRLGARIYDLRKIGHPIKTELINVGKKKVARYYIPKVL